MPSPPGLLRRRRERVGCCRRMALAAVARLACPARDDLQLTWSELPQRLPLQNQPSRTRRPIPRNVFSHAREYALDRSEVL
jgi:hypothetical protein